MKTDFGGGDGAGIDGKDVLEAEPMEYGGYRDGRGEGAVTNGNVHMYSC